MMIDNGQVDLDSEESWGTEDDAIEDALKEIEEEENKK